MYHGCAGLRDKSSFVKRKGRKNPRAGRKAFQQIHFVLIEYSAPRALALLSKSNVVVSVNLGSNAQNSRILKARGPAMRAPYEEKPVRPVADAGPYQSGRECGPTKPN